MTRKFWAQKQWTSTRWSDAARAEDDQEGEIVVGVELGPLPELSRVLQRQRVKMERVSQQSELRAFLVLRPEVEPKRLRGCEQFLDLFFARFYFLAVQRHQVAVHGAILAQTRRVCPPAGRAGQPPGAYLRWQMLAFTAPC